MGTLEELIDENHAIVSSNVLQDSYVPVLSVVDRDLLEPGCQVLLHDRSSAVVGVLQDDVDPLVSVMKVDKAPLESYSGHWRAGSSRLWRSRRPWSCR